MRPLSVERGEDDLDCCGEWSPDGRQFFFRRFREGRADIWVLRERKSMFGGGTTELLPLTSGPLHFGAVVPTGHPGRLLVIGVQLRGENLRLAGVQGAAYGWRLGAPAVGLVYPLRLVANRLVYVSRAASDFRGD